MPFFIFAAIIAGLILLQTILYKKRALKHVTANVTFSTPIAACGDTITITETIINQKALPIPWITLKFEVSRELLFLDMTNTHKSDHYYREDLMSLAGWQQHNRHIRVLCHKRGYFRFKRLSTATHDLLLQSKIVADYPCESTLTVLPLIIFAPEMDIMYRFFCGDSVNRRSPVTDPFAFGGIREYQPWDNYKSINWNASAKKNELMVNINLHTLQRKITLLLNVMPLTQLPNYSLAEKCISLSMTWASIAVSDAVPVRLISNTRDILTDAPVDTEYGCSNDHLNRIGIDLARIDLTKRAIPFIKVLENAMADFSAYTTFIIISANSDPSLQRFLIERQKSGISLSWVLPYDSTSKLATLDSETSSFTMPLEVGYDA